MKKRTGRITIWIFLGLLLTAVALTFWAGSKKIPPEVALAAKAVATTERSEAVRYLPEQCSDLHLRYRQVMNRWEREGKKWIWFRRYAGFVGEFKALITQTETIRTELSQVVTNRRDDLLGLHQVLSQRAQSLRQITQTINEGRLARKDLTQAELAMANARASIKAGKLDLAENMLTQSESSLERANKALFRVLGRYRSSNQIDLWRNWIEETVSESRRRSIMAVVVSKIDKKLYVYRNGHHIQTYDVGLGRNGLSDKKHSGDNATPEGRYRISKKNPNSLYFKALLLDYPNDEDRRTFKRARQLGLIPPRVGIGSLIEIHGGGITYMTRGCIALENDEMNTLYNQLPVGTPVTIVGSSESPKHLFTAIKEIPGE
jgi:hypothetical protein